MWLIGAVLGIFIGVSAAMSRYRGQMGVYLGSVIGAVVIVWLLSSRIPGATGLVFIVSYMLTYGVLQFGVLRHIAMRDSRAGGNMGSAGKPRNTNRRVIDHKDE